MVQVAAKGTKIQLDIASVYTDIALLESLSGGGAEVNTYDATHLGSSAVEMKPTGFAKGKDVSFDCFFDPVEATHQALTDLLNAPAVSNWKIIWSDSANTEWAFTGTLTELDPSADKDDGLKFSATIEQDGVPTYPT